VNSPAPVTTPSLDLGIPDDRPSALKDQPVEVLGIPVEYPGLTDLREKILNLDTALKAKHPAMDSLLQTIHRNLQKDPELIHLLKPEETAIVFAGLQSKTQTQIVTETVKSAGSGRNKGLSKLGLEDL
jgi:hypothetical protein